jgi:hypothetical protein
MKFPQSSDLMRQNAPQLQSSFPILVSVPVGEYDCDHASYSTDIRRAALVAHGAKTSETISVAANNKSHACGSDPVTLAWTAPLPKMSTGM